MSKRNSYTRKNSQTKANKYIQYTFFDLEVAESGILSTAIEIDHTMPQDTHTVDIEPNDMADDKVQDNRSYFTPGEIVNLMVKLLDPEPETTIYDPCCGSGALLRAAIQRLEKEDRGEFVEVSKIYGEEPRPDLCTQAKAALSQFNNAIIDIRVGDALLAPNFLEKNNSLMGFDCIIANPPWNQRGYNRDLYLADHKDRFEYGIPKRYADWGWMQHILASLKGRGHAVILTSMGAITRGLYSESGSELRIRTTFIQRDYIEAVIRLPNNLFTDVTFPCVLLLLNRCKSEDRRGQILVVDASQQFTKENSKKVLTQDGINLIIDVCTHWETREGFSKVIRIQEAEDKRYNLNPSIYNKVLPSVTPPEKVRRKIEPIQAEHRRIFTEIAIKLDDQDIAHLALPDRFNEAFARILNTQSSPSRPSGIDILRQHLPSLNSVVQQEISLQEEYKQSLMHDFFTDPDWPPVRLGDITTISSGRNPSSERKELYGNKFYWVQLQDLNNDIITSTTKMLSEAGLHSIMKKTKARDVDDAKYTGTVREVETVLVAKINACEPQGKWGILGVPAATNVEICCIEPNPKKFTPLYLVYHIIYIRHTWADSASQTRNEPHVRNSIIGNTQVVLPPIEVQQERVKTLQMLEDKINALKSERDSLEGGMVI